MSKRLPVITSRMVSQRILEDLLGSVNEGDVSIPLSNAWQGLQDAQVCLSIAMGQIPMLKGQLARYEKALEISRMRKLRRHRVVR